MNQNQRDDFQRNGFIQLGPILTPTEVKLYKDLLLDFFTEKNGVLNTDVVDLANQKTMTSVHSVLQLVNVYKKNKQFESLIRHPKILESVKCLLGENVCLFRDQAFYKPPRNGGEVYMHQDNRYWHLTRPEAVTVWIALGDATLENGCVQYLEGSHTWGFIEHKHANEGNSVQLEAVCNKADFVPLPTKSGGVNIHDCRTVHFSTENESDMERLGYSIVYMADDVYSKKYPESHMKLN